MLKVRSLRSVAALSASVLAALLVSGCGGGGPQATPAGTPTITVEIAAQNSVFDTEQLAVPVGGPYAIHFLNHDTVAHNVNVLGGPPGSIGELFGGPAERTYFFPALPAGTYTFLCDLHPEMRGTITSS